jgi:hypothetical protein
MTPLRGLRYWLADHLTRAAAARLRPRHSDWADAVISEHASLADTDDRLRWAIGSWFASLDVTLSVDAFYPLLLTVSIATMTLYQWSVDESAATVMVLALLGLLLGLLSPRRFLASGLALGAVVATVTAFEALSGIRPAYEVHVHSLLHSTRWLIFILPTLFSSAVGRQLNLRLLA